MPLFFVLIFFISSPCSGDEKICIPSLLQSRMPFVASQDVQVLIQNSKIEAMNSTIDTILSQYALRLGLYGDYDYYKKEMGSTSDDATIPSYVPDSLKNIYKAIYLPSDYYYYHSLIGIKITKLIIDNGNLSVKVKAAIQQQQFYRQIISQLKASLYWKADQKYYTLFLAKLKLEIGDIEIKRLKSAIQKQTDSFTNRKELREIEDSIALKEMEIDQLKLDYSNAVTDLMEYIGLPSNTAIEFTFSNTRNIHLNIQKLIGLAIQNDVSLLELQNQILQKQYDNEYEKNRTNPTVNFEGGFFLEKQNEKINQSLSNLDQNSIIKCAFEWPLLNGDETVHKIEQNNADIKTIQLEIALKKEQLIRKLKDLITQHEKMNAMYAYYTTHVINIEKKLDDTRNLFSKHLLSEQALQENTDELLKAKCIRDIARVQTHLILNEIYQLTGITADED